MSTNLKPQDVLVLLKLVAIGKQPWTYAGLAGELGVSASEVHSAIVRAQAAPPLNRVIVADQPLPPVWEDQSGTTEGVSISPLYRSVPGAAQQDPILYELLSCVDALRIGRVRERKAAASALQERIFAEDTAA